jgi:TPR repeat protein
LATKPEEPLYYNRLLKLSAAEITAKLAAGPEEAARVAYAAAVGGSPVAQVVYGQMLLDGHGVDRDAAAGFRWFGIAAASGDMDGVNMLGRCYENGWGVAVDRVKAMTLFRQAAAKSHDWAQFNLGMMLMQDHGSPGNVTTALTLFVRAARRGNAKAMNMIGRFRECGWASRIDVVSATRWYRRAARGGCFRGAAHLARLLSEQGSVNDAEHWYRRSIAVAPAAFCRDLAAHLFAKERSILQRVARDALRRAAELGEARDQFIYGSALALGKGGPVNRGEASVWLHRAEAQGIPGALAILNGAGGPGLP